MSAAPLVVLGDVVLDVDVDGTADRLSPEAPVPVVDVERTSRRPGGAGLAALLAARTDADVVLITGVADDAGGRTLTALLDAAGVRVIALPWQGATAVKTRIRARGQSVVRIDQGIGAPVDAALPAEARRVLAAARAVCVADYGRGVAALPAVRAELEGLADRVPLLWDPHPRGPAPVPGCRIVTPNHDEAQQFCRGDGGPAGAVLRRRWQSDSVCVTLGARGARLFDGDPSGTHVPVPRQVVTAAHLDTCGAGDRFAVAAAAALGDGATPFDAVTAAVAAAARFVAAGAATAVSTPEEPAGFTGGDTADHGLAAALALIGRLRTRGRTVVATGGCFDLLHTGHIRLLHTARQHGDALIVLVNSDASVRALKGPGRPVMPAADRARVLAALGCVDAVVVFDDPTPERLLDALAPDVWVKGGDYTADTLPEAGTVRRHGGEIVLVPTVAGYSSTALIQAAGMSTPDRKALS